MNVAEPTSPRDATDAPGRLDRTDSPEALAAALTVGLGVLYRRLRQTKAAAGRLPLPESSALARLDRDGPASSAALARHEQISPQSMGATLQSLERRGLIARAADPADGRRQILTVTEAGRTLVHSSRSARRQRLAQVLAEAFSEAERAQLLAATPLLERLAERL